MFSTLRSLSQLHLACYSHPALSLSLLASNVDASLISIINSMWLF
ncbi:hypothetical protein LINPERHAP2_LOCUS25833 [Linum perenne]